MKENKEKFNQTAYINNYKRTHYRSFKIEVNKNETEVLNKLTSVPNKTAYIIGLIKKDIEIEEDK